MKPSLPSSPPFAFREEEWMPALYVGGLSGALTVLLAQGQLVGLLIYYVPTLLLLALGWTRGVRALGLAAIVAVMVILLGMPAAAPGFLISEALPAMLLLRLSLTYFAIGQTKPEGDAPMAVHVVPAFSVGWALSSLAVYGACMMALFALLAPDEVNPIFTEANINALNDIFVPLIPKETERQAVIKLIQNYLFLVIGMIGWLWVLGLYGCAALARYLAEAVSPVAPRRLGLLPFGVPVALLAMLAIFGAGALLLPPDSLGTLLLKSAFVLLLLPYFLSGVSQFLGRLPAEQPRWPWVLVLIPALALFPAGALIFVAIGLAHPLKSASPKVS